jgi:CDP-diacylglycerol---glycerol-3-phosphate 3-phosphatidyltransferase
MKGIFSTPNIITFLRILFIPVFVAFLLLEIQYKNIIAASIFIILSLSDALDGYIARKHNQVTGIGKIIDPIADKLLISAALIFLIGRIQLWMAVVIIIRELVITVARILFLSKKVMPASYLGKIKTVSQIIAILAVILNFPFNWWLMLIAVVITVVSGLDYLIKMGRIMGENVLNLPNIITTLRLLLIPLFVMNIMNSKTSFALIIFAIIVLSDKLDGISARITTKITRFGRIYDSFTDYLVVISSGTVLYLTGSLTLNWILLLLVPAVILTISKTAYFSKIKETLSGPFGKIFMGICYVAIFSIIIDFTYTFHILVLLAVLAYIYAAFDIYKLLVANKVLK